MPLTVADLLEPKGRITRDHFPGESEAALTARVTEYLTQATALATARAVVTARVDPFVLAWAYHLAFDAAATRMALNPASSSREGEGSHGFTWSQIDAVRRLAEGYKAEAHGYLVAAETTVAPPARWPSTSAAVSVVW